MSHRLSAALARDVGGQVDREAVGVVEPEQLLAGDVAAAARASHVLEDAHARRRASAAKRCFLGLQRALDQLALAAASSG